MNSQALRWFLVGAFVAAASVAAGAAVAEFRRACAPADDEVASFPPADETVVADPVAPTGSIG